MSGAREHRLDGDDARLTFARAVAPGPRRGGVALELALRPGLHALVGGPADGLFSIAPLAGGLVRPRSGRVLVDGHAPFSDAALRRRIGATSAAAALPAIGSVRALVAACARLRGERADPLARIGVATLAERRIASLSNGEARAVDLALALATPRPLAIVVTEPFAGVAGADHAAIVRALAEAADDGACVVVATASVADAIDVGGALHLLEAGRIVRSLAAADAQGLVPGRGLELRVATDSPRELAAALARDPAVVAVSWDAERAASVLTVRGDDPDAAAIAIARKAVEVRARIDAITPVAPGLEEVRAASAGLALAAHHAAYRAWNRAWTPPAPAAPAEPPPTPAREGAA